MSEVTPWTTIEDVRAFASIAGDKPDALVQQFIVAATEILYVHSAQQFNNGVTETVRPCKSPSCLSLEFNFFPSNAIYGPDGPFPVAPSVSCGCGTLQEIEFDHGPILAVDKVEIDGAVFPQVAIGGGLNWRVDDARWLVRLDGNPWPNCQHLELPLTSVGTWAVTYTWGRYAPQAGVLACKQLAAEMTKASLGERCQIPPRTTRMIRQGISIQLQDIKNDEERTGLYFVDVFLRTYNPQGLRSAPYVWSPDLPRRGRQTTQ